MAKYPFFLDYKEDFEKKVCFHSKKFNENQPYYKYFTGNQFEYYIVCNNCKDLDLDALKLIKFSQEDFETLLIDYVSNTVHQPDFNLKPTSSYSVTKEVIEFSELEEKKVLSIFKSKHSSKTTIFCLDDDFVLYKIDLTLANQIKKYKLPIPEKIDIKEKLSIKISPKEKYIALSNIRGRFGLVYDLETKINIYEFDRKDYYFDVSNFPFVFFLHAEKEFFIHGSDWNKLDIIDFDSQTNLTDRKVEYDKIYADYFYGELSVSPNNNKLVSYGWGWAPVGYIRSWDLLKWLGSNIHEPENGESVVTFKPGDEWDLPTCWLDNEHIASTGRLDNGNFDYNFIRIFNVASGDEVGRLPGLGGNLEFNKVLYSYDKEEGTEIYNIETSELIFKDEKLFPDIILEKFHRVICYHGNGKFTVYSFEF
ncbi:MAG: hypothetical protein HeimC3_37940 [Candidatus Heimdallarchaeota archaeon LC_3]|nr:MAG: hypothetical protein HeimC3_50450 [Candidatus Heimdallarchaeota archaeon LC_3]OLS21045.1 MAG: hypothetical protein HeimC3_37940 [Candidatus Heimdallarchaeota archaeon LC_3]